MEMRLGKIIDISIKLRPWAVSGRGIRTLCREILINRLTNHAELATEFISGLLAVVAHTRKQREISETPSPEGREGGRCEGAKKVLAKKPPMGKCRKNKNGLSK